MTEMLKGMQFEYKVHNTREKLLIQNDYWRNDHKNANAHVMMMTNT
jgi:hypothetical protein